jgi:phosphatidylserine synthase
MTLAERKYARRGIFLRPKHLNTAALFAGFYSIVAAIAENFQDAGAAAFVWFSREMELVGLGGPALAFIITATVGALLVSRFRCYRFKGVNLGRCIPFTYLIGIVLIFILISVDPPAVFLGLFNVCTVSGAIYWLWRRRYPRPASGADDAG